MPKSIANLPASVHQRLLNKAKESSRPFNELLQYFAIERFIYRLSKSPYADQFILKGALMFSAWCLEQPHEGFLRHLVSIPNVRFQRRNPR